MSGVSEMLFVKLSNLSKLSSRVPLFHLSFETKLLQEMFLSPLIDVKLFVTIVLSIF